MFAMRLSTLLIAFGFSSLFLHAQQSASPMRLGVIVLEGQGAINNIDEHRAKAPVVEVVDENNAPIKGASVSFLLPDTGPSGAFGDGLRLITVTTDAMGRAAARGLNPNQTAGPFQIRATASYAGLSATATIDQTNAQATANGGHGVSKKLLIIILAGGAAAAGAAVATRGHSAGSTTPAPSGTGTVIVAGSPGFQPPH